MEIVLELRRWDQTDLAVQTAGRGPDFAPSLAVLFGVGLRQLQLSQVDRPPVAQVPLVPWIRPW
jgi:hypothetical protein